MSLEATLDVTVDEEVVFEFRVVNTGTRAVELTFPTGQPGDITVTDRGTGEQVWRWGDDKMFTQALRQTTIEPEDSLDVEFTWSDPDTGTYEAIATLEADVSAAARSSFAV